jgi:hypothetical protein
MHPGRPDRPDRPALGVLLPRGPDLERPFLGMTAFASKVSELGGLERMDVVAFGPDDIAEDGTVLAGRPQWPRPGWRFEPSPAPTVVWNRTAGALTTRTLDWLRAGRCINQMGSDKWRTHQFLGRQGGLRGYLPESRLLTRASDITDLLARHATVFLKPIRGSLGRGIIRVRASGADRLVVEFVGETDPSVRRVDVPLDTLERWLDLPGVAGQYVAQQGLTLCRYEGRPVDLRILVQKDQDGLWCITGGGARVAGPGRFTTNLHTGGRPVLVETLLQALAPANRLRQEELAHDVNALALEIAEVTEQELGPMGELGLDIGIDHASRVWYIEQNTLPGRGIFELTARWDLARLSLVRPIRYARHLGAQVRAVEPAPPRVRAPGEGPDTTAAVMSGSTTMDNCLVLRPA